MSEKLCGFIGSIASIHFDLPYFRLFSGVTAICSVLISVRAIYFLPFSTSRTPNHLKCSIQTAWRTTNQQSTFAQGLFWKESNEREPVWSGTSVKKINRSLAHMGPPSLNRFPLLDTTWSQRHCGSQCFSLICDLCFLHRVFSTTPAKPISCVVALNIAWK